MNTDVQIRSRQTRSLRTRSTFSRATFSRATLLAGLASFLVSPVGQADLFPLGATVQFVDIVANDIAYSPTKRKLYATVPSAAGSTYGNSVVTIDPATAQIVDSAFAGSEPTRISVSDDGTKAYVGIDGARSFRSWRPGTSIFSDLVPLRSRLDRPAVAQDFAIPRGQSEAVIVSKDDVTSSASGDLQAFRNNVSEGGPPRPTFGSDQIEFIDDRTMVAYTSSNTGFDLERWSLDPATLALTSEDDVGGLISGFGTNIEVTGELVFASNGIVVNPETLGAAGTFVTGFRFNSAVESIPEEGRTLFVGREQFGSGNALIKVFDTERFLELEEVDLGLSFGTQSFSELEFLGDLSFALLTSDGQLAIVNAVVPIPAPAVLFLSAIGLLGIVRRRKVREHARHS